MPQTETLRRAALVTGGAKGIGRAICLALAENGVNIAVNYAGSAAAAEETAANCRALGVQAITLQADVRSPEACQKLVEDTVAAFGRIDVLVNNAGITADKLLLRMTEADFDNVLATNLKGAFFCTKAACRFMMHQRYGRIISVSSVVGLHGNAGQANYAASKAGLIGLTKSVAKEYAARNITANVVAPGFIATDMTAVLSEPARAAAEAAIPAGKIGHAGDVAAAVAFLACGLALVPAMDYWPEWRYRFRLLHVHVNLLGFVGLTAIGTLQVLLPTVLSGPDAEASERLRDDLPWAVAGVLATSFGAALWWPLSLVGAVMLFYVATHLLLAWWRRYGVRTLFGAVHGASGGGLLSGHNAVPGFMAAFLFPLVSGALSQLLPVWRFPGRTTSAREQMRDRLASGGAFRAVLFVTAGSALALGYEQGLWLAVPGLLHFVTALVRAYGFSRTGGN